MKKGSKMTQEQRLKISQNRKGKGIGNTNGFIKGQISRNKGKQCPWLLGNTYAKGNKPNSTSFKKGHIAEMSESTRAKISATLTGRKRPEISGAKCFLWKGGVSKVKGYNSFISTRRKIRKLQNGGSHTIEQWEELKKKWNYMCLCCKKSEPEIKLTEDHILPISKNGTDDISNIQPLCISCNSIKRKNIINYIPLFAVA